MNALQIEKPTERQEMIDRFYVENGPCCAGCDHWQSLNSWAGLCTMSKIAPASERVAMLGITGSSLNIGAGHAMTPHDHLCGLFADEFDWSSLPSWYLRKIGHPAGAAP